jgi:hypothetical protein
MKSRTFCQERKVESIMKVRRAVKTAGGLAVLGLVSWTLGYAVRSVGTPVALAEATAPQVEARALKVNGQEVGVLVVGGKEVLRLTQSTGGFTPSERLTIVAGRLKDALAAGASAQDVKAAQMNGQWAVQIKGSALMTTDEAEAKAARTTPAGLAFSWASSLSNALAVQPGQAAPTQPSQPGQQPNQAAASTKQTQPVEWRPEEPYDDKWVPIISVLRGVKLGVARVNGPKSALGNVKAVAQLETKFKSLVDLEVYIPIDADVPKSKLSRVKGCSVTGLGDFAL